jgi:hypothetical protein
MRYDVMMICILYMQVLDTIKRIQDGGLHCDRISSHNSVDGRVFNEQFYNPIIYTLKP